MPDQQAPPVTFEDLPGGEAACQAVEAKLAEMLAEGYANQTPAELARSLAYSLGMVDVGRRPQRSALVRLLALGLITLSKLPEPSPPSVLQAPGPRRPLAPPPQPDVDLDGGLLLQDDEA